MKVVILFFFITILSAEAQVIYKDDGLAPDTCPVQNVYQGTVLDVMTKANAHTGKAEQEPNSEGCLTLKVYANNLLLSLQNDLDQKFCDSKSNCMKGSEIVEQNYTSLVNYLQKTQKPDISRALNNDRNNISNLIINQVQNIAAQKFRDDSQNDLAMLGKVNENIKRAFKLDLNLRPKRIDTEKTQICMDYISCPLQMMSNPSKGDYCKKLLQKPYPQYCTNGQPSIANSAVATVTTSVLSDAAAEEYLALNLDVKEAFEKKSAQDNRTKTQFASDHFRDFSEIEGRPISVKDYFNCNPDIRYGFYDPAVNTNQDEAKTDKVAFVAKHFKYVIQPIMPVSARNFKTRGCIDLEKYFMCYEDVKAYCTSLSQGDRDSVNKALICAFNHYRDNGQKEGRGDSCAAKL